MNQTKPISDISWVCVFSSVDTSYGSLSGCRPGRWAGGGTLGWGWRLGGPSRFWWPPPASGSVWSSGTPAPEWPSGSLPLCSGPAPYLNTQTTWNPKSVPYVSYVFIYILLGNSLRHSHCFNLKKKWWYVSVVSAEDKSKTNKNDC